MSVSLLLDIVSGTLVLAGCVLVVSGGVGLLRFQDFYTRTHAGSLTDGGGAGLLLLGLLLQVESWQSAVRLVLILLFLMLTSPTAAHALAQAARRDGERLPAEGEERR
ncbi:monovalent cation/H(+) antiporter subunit G [Actinomadura sp. 7K507]|uniref:monovalent cation/H(+) antiporter subunit G n=1 Tax=Actinomadura sp. 7K507 TaxID=2530365 RepID=UPI0010472597|nr:monovalent cation/H(+) antiporter subunit G [Actinomadura sp. 7K507]TDC82465.1 sodium:proton antiporter [Actinomadura sp. 7K507]